jgi:hypothetical protein
MDLAGFSLLKFLGYGGLVLISLCEVEAGLPAAGLLPLWHTGRNGNPEKEQSLVCLIADKWYRLSEKPALRASKCFRAHTMCHVHIPRHWGGQGNEADLVCSLELPGQFCSFEMEQALIPIKPGRIFGAWLLSAGRE